MKRFGFYLCTIFFFQLVTFGQGAEVTTLSGVVIDDFGAVIPTAKIIAETLEKKRFEVSTDQEGVYTIDLEAGIYTISVIYPPFLPLVIKDYQIASYVKKMTLDLSLICRNCNREHLYSSKKSTQKKENKSKNTGKRPR
ncbi:MAG: carboxypeptidase regulatory-like domain-containing protein [Chloracidobacterium sp.]|nr:carboxypeptidase regulatory-like domain-containing protein [Chloracidobacterium sp.]